jgi:S1-C subfamily serine protease
MSAQASQSAPTATQTAKRDPTQPDFHNDSFANTENIRAAGKNYMMFSDNTKELQSVLNPLGLGVKNTHTRQTDGTGVLLNYLGNGGLAALAGLNENDIITSVNDKPTLTVEEFLAAVKSSEGSLKITFNRDGRRNIFVILER